MEVLQKNKLLEYPPNVIFNLRKLYNLEKPGKMNEAIDIVLDWARMQNHFQRTDFPRNFVETLIIASKGSVERVKQRLEKLCTYRTLMPNFYGPYNVDTDFKDLNDVVSLVIIPKMRHDYYRVMIFKGKGVSYTPKMFTQYFRYCRLMVEYIYAFDYTIGCIFALDMREMNMLSLLSTVNFIELRQATVLFLEGYGTRIKGIHILSESKMIDAFVKLLQQVLSTKLGGRIYVHKTEETFYDEIPKEYLPEDYGGEQKSVKQLRDEWFELFGSEEFVSYMAERDTFGINEGAREKDFVNTEYMGLPGTFRSLAVD